MTELEMTANILVVDDNPTNLALLSKLLSQQGYKVRPAINGRVALASIEKTLPDLILLDIMMPEVDGYTMCQQLKSNKITRDIPIIFMSALVELVDKVKAFELGAVDYITKPFQHAEVLARVQTHVALRQAQQQLQCQNQQLQQEIAQRQQTELALRESEQRYQQLIQVSPDAICVFNRDDEIIFVNLAALKLFRATDPQDMLGKSTLGFIHPDDHAFVLEYRQMGLSGQIPGASLEYRIICCDGTVLDVATVTTVFNYQGQMVIQAALRDITERKRIELALREREELFRGMFENHSAPMYLLHPADGRIMEANEAAARFYGYSLAELKSMSVYDINQLSRPEINQAIEQTKTGQLKEFEFPHRLASGEIRYVNVHSSPITFNGQTRLFSIMHDVTERRQAEAELRKLSRAVEQNDSSIVITDRCGRIEFVNQGFVKITGYTAAEAVGQNPRILQSGHHTREFYQQLWTTILSGEVWQGELINKRKNGELYWEMSRISPIKDLQGQITHFVAVKNDVTARKQDEIILRQYERMVSSTNDHMSLIDTEYRYQLVNQAYIRAHGKSQAEIVGRTVSELHGQARFEGLIKTYLDQCLAGQLVHYQAWFSYPQVGWRFMDVTYSPHRQADETVTGVVVSARDITELKEIEQRLAYIIDFLPEATFVINQAGQVITWNKAIETMTGVSAVEMLGRGNYEYALPFYGERRPVMIDLLFLPKSEVIQKYTNVHYEGDKIYGEAYIANFRGQEAYLIGHAAKLYNFKGEVVGAIETILDITATRKAANELKQANELLEDRVDELAMLNQVAQTVTMMLDLPTMLESIGRIMTKLLNAQGAVISLLNPGRTELTVLAYYSAVNPEFARYIGLTLPLAVNPVAAQIIATKQFMIVPIHEALPLVQQMMQAEGSALLLHIPLIVRDEVIGVISVSSDQAERIFTSTEIKLAETVAGQVAGAIENIRLFKEEQQQRHMAESLREVTSILNRSLDQKTVLAQILEQLGRVVAHHSAAIFLKQHHHLVVHDAVGVGRSYIGAAVAVASHDPVAQVFRQKQPIIIEDTLTYPHWSVWTEPNSPETIRSWIGVPLLIGDKIIGVLTIDHFTVQVYRPEDAHLVQIFADQAAVAIQNSQLFSTIQQANQRFQDELAFAQEIQRSLTPSAYPHWAALEVICYSMPAYEIGGDFYTYHYFESQAKYAFALGDVSGKGVSAALLMAACLSRFEATLSHDFTPPERLIYLDKVIEPYTKPRHQNCAMCYVEIELLGSRELGSRSQELGSRSQELGSRSQELGNRGQELGELMPNSQSLSPNSQSLGPNSQSLSPNAQLPMPNALLHLVNAGCIPPYIKRGNGKVEFREMGGFALGQGLGALVGYEQLTLPLVPGDIVILVSDGVIEARNPSGNMLGFSAFEQMVAEGPVHNAAEMMAHLQFALADFMGDAAPHDDLTLIVVQV